MFILLLFAQARSAGAQTDAAEAQDGEPYSLSVAVDEVSLTFHAADARALPVNDLKLNELGLLDNGRPPRKILDFQLLRDSPLRAGILMDTSESMAKDLADSRAISAKYAQGLLRQPGDQAFVMTFGRLTRIVQPWTGNPSALSAGIRSVTAGSRVAGTAIFDALFETCHSQFGGIDHATSGNFILLFSDGEENASYVSLREAIDMCQSAHTAIYSFCTKPKSGSSSTGPSTLEELAAESGGRVFYNESEAATDSDLRILDADVRNQYRLIYRPAALKHNGSFHRIELKTPERVSSITIRSGYYAPAH